MTEDSINYGATRLDASEKHESGRLKPNYEILGRYSVRSELGQGGMGVVYKCFDKIGCVDVAVKGLPPEVSHNADEMDEIRDNFQLVCELRHPNIAGIRTLEKDENGDFYLVMDLARGMNLGKWMRKNNEADFAEKIKILRQIASALDYAHERRVMHRDVKPENVMIDADGHVSVLDFGLAAQIRSSMSRASRMVTSTSGTPSYKAPEQWRGRPQTAAVDQYSLGVIAYRMFAGCLPFDCDDMTMLARAVLQESPLPVKNVPEHVNSALMKVLSKEPSERFPDCASFVSALEGLFVSPGVESVRERLRADQEKKEVDKPATRPVSPVTYESSASTVSKSEQKTGKSRNKGCFGMVSVLALITTVVVGLFINAQGIELFGGGEQEDAKFERLRQKGYSVFSFFGFRKAIWRAGNVLDEHPHWVTDKREGSWRIEDGYALRIPGGAVLSDVVWKPGWQKQGVSDIKAGEIEGTWLRRGKCHACGGRKSTVSSSVCSSCGGQGRLSENRQCSACGGSGRQSQSSACTSCSGMGRINSSCRACNGRGSQPCGTCGGSGRMQNQAADVINAIGSIGRALGGGGRGGSIQIPSGPQYVTCSSCGGRGNLSCRSCGGSRTVSSSCTSCSGRGHVSRYSTCSACQGRGSVQATRSCSYCRNGRIERTQMCSECEGTGFTWSLYDK